MVTYKSETSVQEMQQQTRQSMENSPLGMSQGAWQSCLHQLVLGYLVHHGYYNTALTFASNTSQAISEEISSIKSRQSESPCDFSDVYECVCMMSQEFRHVY